MKKGWQEVPFWTIAQRIERGSEPEATLLSVYREWGVIRKADRDDNFNKPSDDLSTYKVVRRGDLVLNKMKTWQGSLGVSPYDGIVSPAYFVCALGSTVDGRFIHHLLRSRWAVAQFLANSKGIRPNQWDLPYDVLRQMKLPLPPLHEQRKIADFLDERVARIDQIIAARTQQQLAVKEHCDREWEAMTLALTGPVVPLRRFLRSIVDGPFGSSLSSKHYADSGTRVIRLGNLGIGEFRNIDRAYIPNEYAAGLQQHEALPGDLIMAGLGDDRWPLGRSAVVPKDFEPAIVKADCYRIRLDDRVDHHFAALTLSSPGTRQQVARMARGATRARLNTEVAREITLPLVSRESQDHYTACVSEMRSQALTYEKAMHQSVVLLGEYKQSLITAAVTGEFDVTTASTKIPGE